MKVWIVQLGYRMDYEVHGVYATEELAEKARSFYMASFVDERTRQNPSWAATVVEQAVQGLSGP